MSTNRKHIFYYLIITLHYFLHAGMHIFFSLFCIASIVATIINIMKKTLSEQNNYKSSWVLSFKFRLHVHPKNNNTNFIIFFSIDFHLWHHVLFICTHRLVVILFALCYVKGDCYTNLIEMRRYNSVHATIQLYSFSVVIVFGLNTMREKNTVDVCGNSVQLAQYAAVAAWN